MQPWYCVILVLLAFEVSGLVAQDESDAIDAFRCASSPSPNSLPPCFSNRPPGDVIFNKFPAGIGMSDSNNDTIFECMKARRIWLNAEAKQGEYIWALKSEQGQPKKKITFYLSEGSSPDTFSYKAGSEDAAPEEGTFKYTDYVHCAVLEMPFHGHQCILWSAVTNKDSLPQECMDKFTDICGVGVPLYKKDLCPDDETSN